MTSKKYFIDLLTASYEVKSFKQVQNIIETDFILTKENNNSATRMEPRISAGDSDDFYSKSNFTWYAPKIDLIINKRRWDLKFTWSFLEAHVFTHHVIQKMYEFCRIDLFLTDITDLVWFRSSLFIRNLIWTWYWSEISVCASLIVQCYTCFIVNIYESRMLTWLLCTALKYMEHDGVRCICN